MKTLFVYTDYRIGHQTILNRMLQGNKQDLSVFSFVQFISAQFRILFVTIARNPFTS